MTDHDGMGAVAGPAEAGAAGPPGRHRWQRSAMVAGSATALAVASLAGSALGFLN
jgi:hypothetical protein